MSRVLPILFNTDMVRAILDGRKTVTRRLVKGDVIVCPEAEHKVHFFPNQPRRERGREIKSIKYFTVESFAEHEAPYQPGDILYVRETFAEGYEEGTYIYKADDKFAELPEFKKSSKLIYRPSIHMPKDAARIWLKINKVEVQKLKDIDDNGAKQEGFADRKDFLNSFLKIYPSCTLESFIWVISFEATEKP